MAQNELAIIDTGKNHLIPSTDDMAIIAEELKDIDRVQFGRIQIAVAGAGVFKVTEPGDEVSKAVTEVVGVIVLSHKCNALWSSKFGAGGDANKMPDCLSMDGVTGTIAATGECRACEDCPYNKFGSAAAGERKGKACKNMRRLYIMREGDILPMIFSLPATAIRPYDNYRTRLVIRHKTPVGVVTKITLRNAKNDDGVEYSTPVFEAVAALPAADVELVHQYAATLFGGGQKANFSADEAGDMAGADTATGLREVEEQ